MYTESHLRVEELKTGMFGGGMQSPLETLISPRKIKYHSIKIVLKYFIEM